MFCHCQKDGSGCHFFWNFFPNSGRGRCFGPFNKKKKKKLCQKSWKEQSSLEERATSLWFNPNWTSEPLFASISLEASRANGLPPAGLPLPMLLKTYFTCNNASKGSILTILFLYALTIDMHISFINSLMHELECLWRHLHDMVTHAYNNYCK